MTQFTGTLSRTFSMSAALVATVAAAIVLAAVLVVGQLGIGRPSVHHSIVTGGAESGTRADVMSQLNSEYLREMAKQWFAPSVRSQLNSEYLREISRDW